jgi:polysaccharide export outer membrane protein
MHDGLALMKKREFLFGLSAAVCAGQAWGKPTVAQVGGAVPAGQAVPTASAVPITDEGYVLGAGDKLRLIVFGEEALSGEFVVSAAGSVSLPLVGEVRAAGATLTGFRASVVSALTQGYLKDPRVSVEVLTYRPFYILGEVARPGEYPYTSGLTVLNAIATAGGYTYRANTRRIFIRAANEAQERALTLNATLVVAPGDTLRVAERFF